MLLFPNSSLFLGEKVPVYFSPELLWLSSRAYWNWMTWNLVPSPFSTWKSAPVATSCSGSTLSYKVSYRMFHTAVSAC